MMMGDRCVFVFFSWICFKDETNIIWEIIKMGVKGKFKVFFSEELDEIIICQDEEH